MKQTKIASEEEAKHYKFPGSPTVRINGVDVDPEAKETAGYVGCRVYFYKGQTYEAPPRELLETALRRLVTK